MANLGKIKKVAIASLIKNDICSCRDDAEHPEQAEQNKVTIFYTDKNGSLKFSTVKNWRNYKVVQSFVDKRMRERLQDCKDVMRRGDIVGAGSVICHVPLDVHEEDTQKFLDGFRDFCIQKFGRENMLMVAEHHHEHRNHSQAYFMPIVRDKKTGQEKLCAKDFFRRELYQSLHMELNQYMDNHMGYHVSIELDEDDPKKRKNAMSVNSLKIKTLKQEIKTLKQEIRKIKKEWKEMQVKAEYFREKLAELEGRINQIYAEYPETRRVRGSRRKPSSEDLEKRYKIDTHPIEVGSGTNERTSSITLQ